MENLSRLFQKQKREKTHEDSSRFTFYYYLPVVEKLVEKCI